MIFHNIHTHKKAQSTEEQIIRNAFIPSRISSHYPVSVGLHPWLIQEDWADEIEKLEKIASHPLVKMIGETGLDRAVNISLDLQKTVLEAHIDLANKLHKPLIFHAVRTYADFPFFLQKIKQKAIFHGFEGNLVQVKSLEKYPVFFSFGKNLLQPSLKIQQVVEYLPLNRILLETDTAPIRIQQVYENLAKMKKIPLLELNIQIEKNVESLWECV